MENIAEKVWIVAGILGVILIIVSIIRARRGKAAGEKAQQGRFKLPTAMVIWAASAGIVLVVMAIGHLRTDRFSGPKTVGETISPTIFLTYEDGNRRFGRAKGRETSFTFQEGYVINGQRLTLENADLRIRGYNYDGVILNKEEDDLPLVRGDGTFHDVNRYALFELRAGENSLLRQTRQRCIPSGILTVVYSEPLPTSTLAKRD